MRGVFHKACGLPFLDGYTKPITRIQLCDKNELLKTVWLHFVFFQPHAELTQLRDGFRNTLDMEHVCIVYPHAVRALLLASKAFDVNADTLLELLVAQFSHQGSNKRTPEESVMFHLSDMFRNVKVYIMHIKF